MDEKELHKLIREIRRRFQIGHTYTFWIPRKIGHSSVPREAIITGMLITKSGFYTGVTCLDNGYPTMFYGAEIFGAEYIA